MDKLIIDEYEPFKNSKYSYDRLFEYAKNGRKKIFVHIVRNKIVKYKRGGGKEQWNPIDRCLSIKKFLEVFLDSMTQKKRIYGDIAFVLCLYDNCMTKCPHPKDLPIFCLSIDKIGSGLLFPPFEIIKAEFAFDKTIDEINEEFSTLIPKYDLNLIHFKGSPSTSLFTQIREKFSHELPPFDINVDTNTFTPIFDIVNYKYLLNLPGSSPWAYRFKYLFLSKRLVIDVVLCDNKYPDRWLGLYEVYFTNMVDYIGLKYNISDYGGSLDELIPESLYNKIRADIIKVYVFFEEHPDEYKKMTFNGYKQAKKYLTLETSFQYLDKLLTKYLQGYKKRWC